MLTEPRHNTVAYSITSSARARSVSGTVSPIFFAVLRLTTRPYFVGACTGKSAGFSPFRMRSTYAAASRNCSALSVGAEVTPVNVRDAGEIERAITAFARSPNGGLVVTGSTLAGVHRDLIITLAARHQLPAVYAQRYFVTGGGLISYGPDSIDPYRRAAGYVDRILKGEKPADLPVQAPTKYELVINLKTAKALGLDVPPTLLARADEVIE